MGKLVSLEILTKKLPLLSKAKAVSSSLGRLIDDATAIEQNVYDPFGGSGTTLIACAQMSRKCFMMELDPNKCNDIINRAVANGLDVIQDGR